MKNVLTYRQFGAVGDGVTDDFAAIVKTHEEANRIGATVLGDEGATYYIREAAAPAVIRTSVDWRGAKFIIDDRHICPDSPARRVWIFEVQRDSAPQSITPPAGMTLAKGQANIGLRPEKPCMLKLEDTTDRIYKRWGENANGGVPRMEMILVDEEGNVDPSTPIQYDYTAVTGITAYSVDESPLTVENAEFLTVVDDPRLVDPTYTNHYCYHARGLHVCRSHVTVKNVHHDKRGEHETVGVPYEAFYGFHFCYDVQLCDAKIIGHRAYSFMDINKNTGVQARNEMGSYEINATDCIDVRFIGLTQREDASTGALITNRKLYHGIMGSNFCRNVLMEACYLDRFDSHQGVYNATIRNSILGFGILVIGGGTLLIENVTRLAVGGFIHLRGDYNSIFDGDVIVRGCVAGAEVKTLIDGLWRPYDNGLPNRMTRSLTVERMTVECEDFALYRIYGGVTAALTDAVNPLLLPTSVIVRGMNRKPRLCVDCPEEIFASTEVSCT